MWIVSIWFFPWQYLIKIEILSFQYQSEIGESPFLLHACAVCVQMVHQSMEMMDNRSISLTRKRSQVRVLFRPSLENELPDMPVEQFLTSLCFEQRGKLGQLGIEKGTFE